MFALPWSLAWILAWSGAAPGPAPESAAPETAAPETAAPETAAPETAAPESAAPETASPDAADGSSPQLVEPAPGGVDADPQVAPQVDPSTSAAPEIAPSAEPEPEPEPSAAAPPASAAAPAAAPVGPRATSEPRAIQATAKRRRGKPEPRYHRAPISDALWSTLIDEDVLMVLSTGYRVCGVITGVTESTVDYEDPDKGQRTAARYMVTAVHEASWECDTDSSIPKVEWALPGTASGLALAGAGLLFGVLQDAGVFNRTSSYAVLGFPTTLLGAPIVGIAGRSTARDLRVRGVPWARTTGWIAFGGAAVTTVLWGIGYLGDQSSPLHQPGLSSLAGGLGLAGAGLLGFDALRSRKEMMAVRRRDAEPAKSAKLDLRFSLTPMSMGGLVHGVGIGVGGRL